MPHPLRPLEGYIIVCEGESDYQFLNNILTQRTPKVEIYWAGGEKNVGPLADILQPAIWIQDRDFNVSFAEAQNTLATKKRQAYWPRHDIECYLLYEDWLLEAVREIERAPQKATRYVPPNEN